MGKPGHAISPSPCLRFPGPSPVCSAGEDAERSEAAVYESMPLSKSAQETRRCLALVPRQDLKEEAQKAAAELARVSLYRQVEGTATQAPGSSCKEQAAGRM